MNKRHHARLDKERHRILKKYSPLVVRDCKQVNADMDDSDGFSGVAVMVVAFVNLIQYLTDEYTDLEHEQELQHINTHWAKELMQVIDEHHSRRLAADAQPES